MCKSQDYGTILLHWLFHHTKMYDIVSRRGMVENKNNLQLGGIFLLYGGLFVLVPPPSQKFLQAPLMYPYPISFNTINK